MITMDYGAPSLPSIFHYRNNNSWSHNLYVVHIIEINTLVQVLFGKTEKKWLKSMSQMYFRQKALNTAY